MISTRLLVLMLFLIGTYIVPISMSMQLLDEALNITDPSNHTYPDHDGPNTVILGNVTVQIVEHLEPTTPSSAHPSSGTSAEQDRSLFKSALVHDLDEEWGNVAVASNGSAVHGEAAQEGHDTGGSCVMRKHCAEVNGHQQNCLYQGSPLQLEESPQRAEALKIFSEMCPALSAGLCSFTIWFGFVNYRVSLSNGSVVGYIGYSLQLNSFLSHRNCCGSFCFAPIIIPFFRTGLKPIDLLRC